MHDRPTGAALLDIARQALLDEIAPGLVGHPRYVALMVANAIGIAAREIELADRSAHAWTSALAVGTGQTGAAADSPLTSLVEAIRAGDHDADAKLFEALRETVNVAAAILKPRN